MSYFFVAYSGKNIEKVSAIIYFLAEELGSNRFWFAPTQTFDIDSVNKTLRNAIASSDAVLSFESASSYRIIGSSKNSVRSLSRSEKFLLYEREEAERLNKRIINVAISKPTEVGLNIGDEGTFDLSMRLSSKTGRTNLAELTTYLQDI